MALIPCVSVETGRIIASVICHNDKLTCHILSHVDISQHAVFGNKRRTHVEAIQPHLVRIDLLVPEATLRCPRVGLILFEEMPGGG